MSDLLKQAIADAKAVRATALANAKHALEEAFAPKLQSMLATKLQQEVEGDEAEEELPAPEEPLAPAEEVPVQTDVSVTDEVPVDGAEVAPDADVAPEGEPAPVEEPVAEEPTVDEYKTLEAGHPDAVDATEHLTETDAASSDYKKTTSGHRTESPQKGNVVGKAVNLKTSGGPKEGPAERTANSNYKTGDTGKRPGDIKNMKNGPVGGDDIQGQGDELACGPKKDQGKLTDKTLEESEIDEATLDEILKELEQESSQEEYDMPPQTAPVPVEQDEEINLDELFESKDEEDDKKEDKKDDEEKEEKDSDKKLPPWLQKENISLKKELQEYRSTVQYLRDQINEVNLLNAKLLYTNKLFKQRDLTNEQKLRVIEQFDLTKSVREAKLTYANLSETLSFGGKKTIPAPSTKKSGIVKTITEGLASKPVASTKPTATVLTEGAEMANRFKKLAGIRK
jgi:hypothetical protein